MGTGLVRVLLEDDGLAPMVVLLRLAGSMEVVLEAPPGVVDMAASFCLVRLLLLLVSSGVVALDPLITSESL